VTRKAILILIPLAVVALAGAWVVAALTWNDQPSKPRPARFHITADGAPFADLYLSSLELALRQLRESDVSIGFGGHGTTPGFRRLCAGGIDMVAASRPIDAAERAACRRRGIHLESFAVAATGLAMVTPKDADVGGASLTRAQLRAILSLGSKIERWSQVPGGRFADRPLTYVGPEPSSPPSHHEILRESVLGGDAPRRPDVAAYDDVLALDAVARTEAGLAAVVFPFRRREEALRAFTVDGVAPTPETVASGRYPLSRPLILYVRRDAFGRGEITAFLARALRDGASFASQGGLVPAPAPVLAEGWRRANEVSSAVGRQSG
jgi:phosphate transport system substrate-binding protein